MALENLAITPHTPQNAIYESPDALEDYLADVRQRREQHRAEREKRRHWETALQKVTAEIQAAQCDEDWEIVEELKAVLHSFEERLVALPTAFPKEVAPAPPLFAELVAANASTLPDTLDRAVVQELFPPPVEEPHPVEELCPVVESHLTPEERETLCQTLWQEMDAASSEWDALKQEGLTCANGELNRPQCFRLRALACRLGRIRASAQENDLTDALLPDIQRLLDDLHFERRARNDRLESLPFDEDCWTNPAMALSPEQWEELAEQYRQMAAAEDAWNWLVAHQEKLSDELALPVVNAIAAVQQTLYRTLQGLEGWDKLQETLYKAIREKANLLGFVKALAPYMSDDELAALAHTLPQMLTDAQHKLTVNQEKEAKEARRQAAIVAVIELCQQEPELGRSDDTLTQDRERLLPLLAECLASGVPPTNKEVREAILHCAPRILSGQTEFRKFLEAVEKERARRKLDAIQVEEVEEAKEEAEPSDSVIADYKEAILLFTTNKRMVILGGVPRQRTCDDLMEAVGFADVKWLQSKESDKAAKFESEIKRANILLVLKNFARHNMAEKGREWIRSVGGHFLLLPSGYGVNQIIHQLYKYVHSEDAHR